MDYDALLSHVIDLLQREKRVPYRALKRRFDIDDDCIEDLKIDIIEAKQLAVDENDRILVWVGEPGTIPQPTAPSTQIEQQSVSQESQPISVEPPPTDHRSPEAERRQLTVMFCDLVDSTKLSSQLDPEDYREVVRAYQQVCSEVIQRYDGHIAQYLGDGLLVYFGYPVAHEEDAQRAIHTGLGILQTLQTLNARLDQEKGIRLAVRLGLHTGLVVVGEMGGEGHQEQLALGETPNLAARVQGLAEPDTVVISAETYRLTQGYFDCETIGERALRGVVQPIVVYRVLGDSGVQSRFDVASSRGLTPLVGRESESTLLFERWAQAKDGNGQVVLLSGEAGIGKSRLVQVLKDHVSEGPHTRLECRSSPYFTNSALYPITDFLQRALQFHTDDTPEQRLEKFEQNLSQYRLPLEETVPLFGALLSLPVPEEQYPPLSWTPQRQRQKTLEAIVTIILELAERQPVLFILEDLHWTDPTTLKFLSLLVEQVPTTSLCVLLTCRPHFQPSWHHRSYLTEVTVNRLSHSQIARMAQQVADGKRLPTEVIQQLVGKSDGVPLYVEEMTKSVLESGVLKETNGHYELVGSVASLSIPATLQDSLMARLDRLVTAKGVAQYGSVIGRQFSYEVLQAVSGLDEATLQRELGRLVEAELVYQRGVVPSATYIFKHALIQDTAYESLLRSTRQGYHRRISEVLEERFPEIAESQPELLAYHYTEAGQNEKAVSYWQKAGEQAIHRSANPEAIANLTQGLKILHTLPDTPERIHRALMLQTALGAPLMATKGFMAPEVKQNYTRALELCERVGDSPQLFPILTGLRRHYTVTQDFETSRQIGERLKTLARQDANPMFLIEACFGLGVNAFWSGDFVLAQGQFAEGIDIHFSEPDDVHTSLYGLDPRMTCLIYAALNAWMLGFPERALQRSLDALARTEMLAHPHTLAFTRHWAIILHVLRREVQAVQQQAGVLAEMSAEQGFRNWFNHGTCLRDWALAVQGQAPGAEQMHQSLLVRHEAGSVALIYLFALLAEAFGTVGQPDKGLLMVARAHELLVSPQGHFFGAEIHRINGELLLSQSAQNASEAEPWLKKALDIACYQQSKSFELRASTSLARLWQSQGKRAEARELLEPVYSWFTEGFDTADLIDAKTLLDELA